MAAKRASTGRSRGRATKTTGKARSIEKSQRDARLVMDCLRRIVRAIQTAARSRSSSLRLTGAQLWVLHQISRQPGITLTQLAALTLTNASTVSEVTSKLARAGYVKRASHRFDGRTFHLTVTPRGASILRHSGEALQEKLTSALFALPAPQLARLADGFEKWVTEAHLKSTPASMIQPTASARRT